MRQAQRLVWSDCVTAISRSASSAPAARSVSGLEALPVTVRRSSLSCSSARRAASVSTTVISLASETSPSAAEEPTCPAPRMMIFMADVMMTRSPWRAALLLAACALLAGCGTTHATIETTRGEQLMLLGYDPVAYFTDGRPVRGSDALPATHDGRTYYFSSPRNREAFASAPARYEPQYGGFCSNGAPYGVKLGSDPTQFEIRDGRLFIFGDVLGHEFWLMDERANIAHA